MAQDVIESGNFTNTTQAATPLTITGARRLIGVLCNSTSTGTFAITDSDANVVTGVITPAAGADVNVRDSNGQTVLLKAEKKGHGKIVRMLLESGAEEDRNNSWIPR